MLLIGGLPLVHRVMYTCSYFLPSILLVRMFGRRGGCLLLRLLFLECFNPRDAQRDFSKRAEKSKADLGGEQVILCHTKSVLR